MSKTDEERLADLRLLATTWRRQWDAECAAEGRDRMSEDDDEFLLRLLDAATSGREGVAPTDANLLNVGYAPGAYLMNCPYCKEQVSDVDKRSVSCRPCAVKRWLSHRANEMTRPSPPVTSEERVEAATKAVWFEMGPVRVNATAMLSEIEEAEQAQWRTAEKYVRAALSAIGQGEDLRAEALSAAIDYAIDQGSPSAIDWLRAWRDGDPDVMAELDRHRAVLSAIGQGETDG